MLLEFTRILARTLADSADVEALLEGEELTSVGIMTRAQRILEASEEGRDILVERPLIGAETVSLDALMGLPEDTLGGAYARHMNACGLDIDGLGARVTRGPSEATNYLLERVRQTHDIWHTLLDLTVAPHEEVLVHSFQWPQLRMPYSAFVMFFGAIKHFIGEARLVHLRKTMWEAVAAGREASPLLTGYWERRWEQPIEEVRREFRIRPSFMWRGMPGT